MKVRGLIARIFPPPRRRLRALNVLPLAVFLVAFLGTWIFLELRGIVQFTTTWPLYLLAVTPWIWWMSFAGLSGLGRVRAVLALVTRLTLVGLFVMLLAEPRSVRRSDILSVVYALDVSDSIGEKMSDDALTYIGETVTGKPEKDEAGLVVFGRDAAVELPPRVSFPLEAINSRVTKDGTNIEKALSLAGAVLPEENQGRIVLISDGTQTEGNLTGILDELKSRGIAVDVLPVEYDYRNEVWLERLELPRYVKAGETYEASVILSSLEAGTGKLRLTENGQTVFEDKVDFNAGKNRYVLPLYMRGPGYYEYAASIEIAAGKDGWEENNVAINHLHLGGQGKVLVVTDSGPDAEPRDWETLVETMKKSGRAVELRLAYDFPRDALSLMPYDCIIFPNVPADAFDVVQLQALHDAVYNQGVGFLMVGGKNSFGPGGYHRSLVEKVLPVSMDISQKKVLPKGALVIVLHTCEFAQGNTWGKRIAKEAIRVLGAKDEAGVLVYDWQGGERWLFKLTPAGEYERLVPLINKAQIGDMPSFSTTMQMGLDGLKASDAAMKHMIVISDGDPSPPTPALVKGFVDASISVTTIAINPHGGSDISVMRAIAARTGGRYYFPKDPRRLPSIFIKEAKTLKRSMIQNKTFTPEVCFPSEVLKGIDALPPLHAYVLTTPKASRLSQVILKGPETEEIDPVLSVWKYGLGTTAAFTSDLSTNWGRDWVLWEGYRAFVEQLITAVSRVRKKSNLHMQTFPSGNTGIISVEDHDERCSFLEVEAQVSGPRRQTRAVVLRQVGPGRYRGQFPLWGKGLYQVVSVGVGDGRTERALGGFAVPYSPEYLRFRSNPIVLRQIVTRTGGRMLTGREKGEDIFSHGRAPKDSTRPIFDWFLILIAILVPLDVGIRRIQIDLRVIAGLLGLGRGKKAPSKTLGALLQVKKRIKFSAGEEKKEREFVGTAPTGPPAARVKERPAPGPEEKEKAPEPAKEQEPDTSGLSTTERLLRMKKKWKHDDHI